MVVRYRSLGLGLALLGAATACAAQAAPELQGAGAALKVLSERRDAEKEAATSTHPVAALRRDLKAFREQAPMLISREAAQRWLQLFDRYRQIPQEQLYSAGGGSEALSPAELLEYLPPPAAWSALGATLEARFGAEGPKRTGDAALLLLGHLLTGDVAGQRRDLASLKTLGRDAGEGNPLTGYLPQLWEAIGRQSNEAELLAAALEARAAQLDPAQNQTLEVPDLVTLLGPQKAEAVLRKLLVTPGAELSIPTGDATQKLARHLTVELIAQLKTPQWTLAHSLDAIALYQALEKRFPAGVKPAQPAPAGPGMPRRWARMAMPDMGEINRSQARLYYLLALVVAQKVPQATAVAGTLSTDPSNRFYYYSALEAVHLSGQSPAVAEFLRARLTTDVSQPLWEVYLEIAARAGKQNEMVTLARATLARKDLPPSLRALLRTTVVTADLAADRVDEGVALLRQLMNEPPLGYDGEPDNSNPATQLVRLGRLLKRPELVRDGIRALSRRAEDRFDPSVYYFTGGGGNLAEMGEYADAEKLLLRQLSQAAQSTEPGQAIQAAPPLLTELARLYGRLGRHADVRTLLDQADSWGVADLMLLSEPGPRENVSLPFAAAEALAEGGKKDAAIAILEEVLRRDGTFDPAYELLVRLRGSELLPLLDQLAKQDRLEERPLIWKAQLLHQARREEEAEQAARAAIALDPRDEDQPAGRRMRAYAVLAEICTARGDKAQAEQLQRQVQAIRLAEQADEWYEAGLFTRAGQIYQEALKLDPDNSCIEARLALQHSWRGDYPQAEAHYQHIFERMSDRLGRTESFCYGCSGIFLSRRAQGIAEKSLTAQAQKAPMNASVQYLLGYLRENQRRYKNAVQHYQAAVRLDPEYQSAWKQLASVGEAGGLPEKERDAAALNLLRLDPQSRHMGYRSPATVNDLKALWTTVEAIRREHSPRPVPTSLYPLAASAKALESPNAVRNQMAPIFWRSQYGQGEDRVAATPGKAIATHPIVQLLIGIIQMDIQMEANQ